MLRPNLGEKDWAFGKRTARAGLEVRGTMRFPEGVGSIREGFAVGERKGG